MALGAALSGLGGSLLGFAGNLIGSGLSFRRQKQLMEHQAALNYRYSQMSAENSPTWSRHGLESAGYNPMLAVQNATSGVNSNFAAQSTANEPDFGSTLGSALSNATDVARLRNESSQTESINDRNYAEADNLKSQAAINAAKLPFVEEREKKEIANVAAQSAKLENDIHFQDEMLNYYQNSLKLQEMGLTPQIINAGANATNAHTNRLQYQIDKEVQDIIRDKEKRYKEWGNKHPYLRNVDESITRYFNGFGVTARKSSVSKR